MKTKALGVEGRDAGQKRGKTSFPGLLTEVVKHHGADSPSGPFRFDKVSNFSCSGEDREGIIGMEHTKSDNRALFIFRGDGRISFTSIQDCLESIMWQRMVGEGSKARFNIMIENINDRFPVRHGYRTEH